ncbi:hypothetical protein LNTAR_01882 [Lentisphaera araneosa HTCC2155]|jgi:hypothetical protein|uniref:DUF3465 domain-containing protein n=1 Tax=Lentisphaera araneosa HTCC2155 TaxID=313628 RepID=A6DNY6_9BACT|nr:DUF3465 domain-containing protein [Lentisphaera araneosa]EDM26518.1 hypothetical protein LNTAR_01882 [Lentisphaera araneosa HTCC2155]
MKNFLIILVIATIAYAVNQQKSSSSKPSSNTQLNTSSIEDQRIQKAFRNQQSDIQVKGSGSVIKVLPDDTKGSKHQKFILKLASGQTVLIAHNIDLAPRINSLRKGDIVSFNGEYEWNSQGGVIHWTHHDPQRRHEDGWLKHKDKIYK